MSDVDMLAIVVIVVVVVVVVATTKPAAAFLAFLAGRVGVAEVEARAPAVESSVGMEVFLFLLLVFVLFTGLTITSSCILSSPSVPTAVSLDEDADPLLLCPFSSSFSFRFTSSIILCSCASSCSCSSSCSESLSLCESPLLRLVSKRALLLAAATRAFPALSIAADIISSGRWFLRSLRWALLSWPS